jgi:hypothetical protein
MFKISLNLLKSCIPAKKYRWSCICSHIFIDSPSATNCVILQKCVYISDWSTQKFVIENYPIYAQSIAICYLGYGSREQDAELCTRSLQLCIFVGK